MRRAATENEIFTLLEPLLAEVFETDDGGAVRKTLDYDAFVRSPLSLNDRLAEFMERAMKKPEVLVRHGAALMKAVQLAQSIQEAQMNDFRTHPVFEPIVSALKGAVARKGMEKAYQTALQVLAIDPSRVVLPARLSVIATQRPEMAFDEWAELLSREFLKLCETWYRPTLATLLLLVNDPKNAPPTQVGQLMAQCEAKWKDGPLALLLPREIVIVRNAIAHEDAEPVMRDETITFTNRRPNGTVETVGPWTRKQFAGWVQSVTDFLLATLTAFLEVFGEHRDAVFIEEGKKLGAALP